MFEGEGVYFTRCMDLHVTSSVKSTRNFLFHNFLTSTSFVSQAINFHCVLELGLGLMPEKQNVDGNFGPERHKEYMD